MQKKKHYAGIIAINCLLFIILFILHYTNIININIKNAAPIIMLPLIVAFSIFNSPAISAAVGLIVGICMDGVSSRALCFNAIVIMLIALFSSLFFDTLFNKNIRSAVVISLIVSAIYYILRWVIFFAFNESASNNLVYLLNYALPSALYTSIFIFPFYFLYKYFNKIQTK